MLDTDDEYWHKKETGASHRSSSKDDPTADGFPRGYTLPLEEVRTASMLVEELEMVPYIANMRRHFFFARDR